MDGWMAKKERSAVVVKAEARGQLYLAMVSPPVGRGVKERYAFLWRPEKVDSGRRSDGRRGDESTPTPRRHRLAWAVLLARVFQFELTLCDRCGGKGKIVAAVTDRRSIRTYLEGIGLPALASARQLSKRFDFLASVQR